MMDEMDCFAFWATSQTAFLDGVILDGSFLYGTDIERKDAIDYQGQVLFITPATSHMCHHSISSIVEDGKRSSLLSVPKPPVTLPCLVTNDLKMRLLLPQPIPMGSVVIP